MNVYNATFLTSDGRWYCGSNDTIAAPDQTLNGAAFGGAGDNPGGHFSGDLGTYELTCSSEVDNMRTGSRVDGKLTIHYIDSTSGFWHTATGNFQADLE